MGQYSADDLSLLLFLFNFIGIPGIPFMILISYTIPHGGSDLFLHNTQFWWKKCDHFVQIMKFENIFAELSALMHSLRFFSLVTWRGHPTQYQKKS